MKFHVKEYWAVCDDWAIYSTHSTIEEAEAAKEQAISDHLHNSFKVEEEND